MKSQSILFGNGLNRLTDGNPSWDDLMKDIAKEDIDKNIPNTLRYEAVIVSEPYRAEATKIVTSDGKSILTSDGHVLYASGEVVEAKLKKDIAERISAFQPNFAYDTIAKLKVDHYMTTNYDNTLLKAIGEKSLDVRYRPEKIYSIRRCYALNGINGKQSYWPLHGNIDSPASIMLGYDHYCGALSKIESYVKGGYEMPNVGRIPSLTSRLEEGLRDIYSWIDLFFITDVHIIGLDLKYEELDLWWVLNRRQRIRRKDPKLVNNRIVYYPVDPVTEDKRQLFKGFDVEVCDLDYYSKDYPRSYNVQLLRMEEMMKNIARNV